MLTGVFQLHEQEARQVMTPIPAVVTVDVSETVGQAIRRAVSTGHSRLIVTEDEDQDHVRGIVHVNQLVKVLMENGEEASFESRVRDAPIVPETKPLDDLLADLQRERTELGVVIDEYGRTAGIVTIEDIIEEIVGEISDESDPDRRRDQEAGQRRLVRSWPRPGRGPGGLRPRSAGRHRRLQLGRRVRVCGARAFAETRRLGRRQWLLDQGRISPAQPDRGGQDPPAPARDSSQRTTLPARPSNENPPSFESPSSY